MNHFHFSSRWDSTVQTLPPVDFHSNAFSYLDRVNKLDVCEKFTEEIFMLFKTVTNVFTSFHFKVDNCSKFNSWNFSLWLFFISSHKFISDVINFQIISWNGTHANSLLHFNFFIIISRMKPDSNLCFFSFYCTYRISGAVKFLFLLSFVHTNKVWKFDRLVFYFRTHIQSSLFVI